MGDFALFHDYGFLSIGDMETLSGVVLCFPSHYLNQFKMILFLVLELGQHITVHPICDGYGSANNVFFLCFFILA